MAVVILAGTHAVTLTWLQTVLGILLPCLVTAFGSWVFAAETRRARAMRLLAAVVPVMVYIIWNCDGWWGWLGCKVF